MSTNGDDLNQNAPDNASTALIVIDMINDLEFPGGKELFDAALTAAEKIALLKRRAQANGIPVIFANDNFGRWRSNFHQAIRHCLNDDVRGGPLARRLNPSEDDYFILKPKHSAFYATPLELLLQHLQCHRLILCGTSGNMCVQFTACDAHMRDYELYIPSDCIASYTKKENDRALEYLESVLGANTTPSEQLDMSQFHR